MNKKSYKLGLFEAVKLEVEDDGNYHYYIQIQNDWILLVCDKEEKAVRFQKRQNDNSFVSIPDDMIEKNAKKDISDDGYRWEGNK